jgi:hypothetical protein
MPSSNRESQRSLISTFVIDTDGDNMLVEGQFVASAHRAESAASGDHVPDSLRCLRSNTANLHQQVVVGRDDTLDRSEMSQEAVHQCRTDARQPLQHVQSLRCEAFRLPVVSLENRGIGSRQLPGEQSQDAERVFRIACVNHRKPPQHRQTTAWCPSAREHRRRASAQAWALRGERSAGGDFARALPLGERVVHPPATSRNPGTSFVR